MDGQQIEARPAVRSLYEELSIWLSRGYVLTLDYGHPRPLLHDPVRAKGTALCYHRHAANEAFLERVGRQDITAHADFTQLAEEGARSGFDAALFCSQGAFLSHLGAERIPAFLNGPEETARERASTVQQLVHPAAMGEKFWVLAQTREAALPPVFSGISNRIRRLKPPA